MTLASVERPEARGRLDLIRVRDVVHRGIFAVGVEAPLQEAARVMADRSVHCVVVRAADQEADVDPAARLWGVISELDLLAAVAAGGFAERMAGDTAVTPLVVVDLDDTLLHAVETMHEQKVTHLVVVDHRHGGEAVGVVSALDVARVLAG